MLKKIWQKNQKYLFAFAIIVGTTVGAGIFAIPYVIFRAGIIPGLFYFILLGGAVLLLHILFGEVVLRTDGHHRLIGYAQIYLGSRWKILATFSNVIGIVGALLVYIIIGGEFMRNIFLPLRDIPSFYWALFFWFILSTFIFRGIKLIAPMEVAMNAVFIIIIFLIFIIAIPKFNIQSAPLFDAANVFLPYGVLLFAFAGWLAIPEAAAILKTREERAKLKEVIIWSALTATLLYFVFTAAVIGASGAGISKDALTGLLPALGGKIVVLGSVFGAAAVAASFLVLGNYLKNALHYDYRIPRIMSALLVCGIPLILFLAGFREFIKIIGVVGAFIGAIEGMIIIFLFRKAKTFNLRQPEYALRIPPALLYFLAAIFLLGAVLEGVYFKVGL
ncbi:MAG: hypothetical protein A2667_02185 [Candidatus Wildermuthbacteria bacterium RIFCSPHIGHO2_01_FULL_47_27]|uniref:Amino acid transporter transmembrane domain-containing protein n=2 Tax=Candidatus Wildermuthiibacteriota TaxID=1817923 RepID=A0A1G2RM89_9BACT|nr:MAG: Aromatic amino acid permease [Parcubacteria group bacterium GW2011_GWA2_47_9]OHA63497.1 MAG: hypothetical protein A2667_02185 [Candidatus Wildermuthbacteria bacterium RIFCSPHIGHO2_01_FULL_47_27]OHA67705.1 MAG: hypothetical protein A3D59_04710 [Candidatus Wildermuthbacteria bacterium RIFCSPHIGHO2_02_FULL_47_17]OHA73985.1 MAG: hypothetical protein A3A32_01085 [Candidatus Wildermuthbacteria bacterium RIFCSPLOWO2_01_FULL_48_35]OHA75586.1 MAG: hypothetical protein A3I38_03790 [Candidatus Wil